ncbi:HD domain-containing protein [Agromyces humi]|uniref:HD domain-containing protein n=1 Tax=Agromyces humi TaxID=1766800 RepID=UPI00135C275C|nr:HD domain-containing protein [Agromyces humi]
MMNVVNEMRTELPMKGMDTALLSDAIIHELNDPDSVQTIRDAISFAAYYHRNDTRAQRGPLPRGPYIEHPLRNTLRLVRYGVRDVSVIVASILHDTVEDHAAEIGEEHCTDANAEGALKVIRSMFGEEVANIVRGVTNPDHPAGLTRAEKHDRYRSHVAEAIADPKVALVKVSDFVDNACSLSYTADGNARMTRNLAAKYEPLFPVFEDRMVHPDIIALGANTGEIRRHLQHGAVTLAAAAAAAAEAVK